VNTSRVLSFSAILLVLAFAGTARAGFTTCRLDYQTHAWSVFYRNVTGTGTVTCEDGERAEVTLQYHGGGITFGVSDLSGVVRFSQVRDASEVLGAYFTVEGHAGLVHSVEGRAGTRGPVWISQAGNGRGFDLGFAFGALSIRRR
jgi:hypothetical protein